MDTQRVWDYAGDCYVHRLIQNRADGKLVEVPEMPFVDVEKSDKMAIEYSHLMTTQLDSQRQYYETELERAYAQAVHVQDEYQHKLDHETAQWKTLQTCVDVLTQENNTLKNKLKEAMRDNKQLHAKLDKAEKALVEQAKKLEEEALMNQLLRQNQVDLKKLIDARDADVQDLQEQVRDLMVFLETRDKIEKDAEDRGISTSELQQATIMTVPSKTKKKKKNK
jgi:BRCA1-associated protein